MDTTSQTDSTSLAFFLLSGGGYATPVAIVLSIIIAFLALRKGIMALACIFLGIAVTQIFAVIQYRNRTGYGAFWMPALVLRHVGQLCRLAPLLVMLWMVIKADNRKGGHDR
jgi:hypothetical protein